MHYRKLFLLSPLILLVISCENKEGANQVIERSINHYFPNGLEYASISLDFRDRTYTTTRYPNKYIYTRSFQDSLGNITDILMNSQEFTRTINGDTVDVSEEWSVKYSSSINSVLYFIQLPYVLNDPAANKKLIGEREILGKPYFELKITFSKDGGGDHYDDEFIYWINKELMTIDFFAYNYTTDGGGVRFREAINQRRVDGLLFQDYINYEVAIGTELELIPQLFMNGDLKVLSKIINENISVTQLDE